VDHSTLASQQAHLPQGSIAQRHWVNSFAPLGEGIAILPELLIVRFFQHGNVGDGVASCETQLESTSIGGDDRFEVYIPQRHPAGAPPLDAVRGGEYETTGHQHTQAAKILFRAALLIRRAGLGARACFAFAHRARWAAAILARPAALMRPRLPGMAATLGGRPALPCPAGATQDEQRRRRARRAR